MPERIQRKRTKGWRMPEGAVYVGRPSKWGNPWSLADWAFLTASQDAQRDLAVTAFRQMINEWGEPPACEYANDDYPGNALIRRELCGKDLACWCPLDQPCHADVLLEIANRASA